METEALNWIRIHDLLEVDPRAVRSADREVCCAIPPWVRARLRAIPFVVVRRGERAPAALPAGVRGAHRHERFAVTVDSAGVIKIITPADLLGPQGTPPAEARRPRQAEPGFRTRQDDREALPALACLQNVRRRWSGCEYDWGPSGSVGFELATGAPAVSPASDLDLVLYADRPLSWDRAHSLLRAVADLPVQVDARVETPGAGFSLAEYVRQYPGKILLRTARGQQLGTDPWSASTRSQVCSLSR
jgi:phosphoribosyl-dephospho-CoA transferase